MNSTLETLSDRIDLEKRFVLWLVIPLALLALAGGAYGLIEVDRVGFFATGTLVFAVGAIALTTAHYVLIRPIRRLAAMAKAVGSGDFSKRLDLARRDEIGILAHEMDTMCAQLQAARLASEAHIAALEQLRHADRIATLGRLASSVAHELGNPLNVIELRAQLIGSGDVATLAEAQRNAELIVEQTQRMTRIIGEILSFARVRPARIQRLDLKSVLHKAAALSEHTAKKHRTRIVLDVPEGKSEIDGDPDKLLQVIVNLLINGVEATPGGGVLHVSLRDEARAPIDEPHAPAEPHACIDVTDHGVGIPADLQAKVFDPFFSTKGVEGGTGLGLSIAQGIVREHEGFIVVDSEVGCGSSFKVYLPKRRLRGEARPWARDCSSSTTT